MSELFDITEKHRPLADRMRPRTLDEFVGQEAIIGKGRLLRRAIKSDRLSSIILYGPPGTGKTTLARIIAQHTKSNFVSLNAVLAGMQQIRDAVKTADENKKLYDRKTILFVDEVHRWNKSQQDALLPWVENGTVIFIGATTENPFFEVNKALVSRSRVFKLELLNEADLAEVARRCLQDRENGYGKWNIEFEAGALEHLIKTASGDARSLLNALELAIETTPETWPLPTGKKIYISKQAAEESIQQRAVLYDADGDYHYDVISAFIKSIRGSDVDATLYWLARMIVAGEAPHFIFRRLLISACEDVGMANPNAISVVNACLQAFDAVGLPEGQYHLAHASIYLASSPKSNSSLGFFDAVATVKKENAEVPQHLRDANRDTGLGDGVGYLYPHQYRNHWVAQQYLPDDLVGKVFYKPSQCGYEKEIAHDVLAKREAQLVELLEARLNPESKAPSTHSAYEFFLNNTESNRKEILQALKEKIIERAAIREESRVLVYRADNNLLLWEVNRITANAVTCGLCKSEKAKAILEQYALTLDDFEKPFLQVEGVENLEDYEFDTVLSYFPYGEREELERFFTLAKKYITANGTVVFAVQNLQNALRLAEFLRKSEAPFDENFIEKVLQAENDFFAQKFPLNKNDIMETAARFGFSAQFENIEATEKRSISEQEIAVWFSKNSVYGAALGDRLLADEQQKLQAALYDAAQRRVTAQHLDEFWLFELRQQK